MLESFSSSLNKKLSVELKKIKVYFFKSKYNCVEVNPQQAVCCLCWCSHGFPSREVMLRNVAGVSRLAAQTPHQPRLPLSPCLLTSLPLSSSSLCALEHRRQLISVPCSWRLLGHMSRMEKKKSWYILNLNSKCKRKVCLFLCVFMHERKMKERLRGHVTEGIHRINVHKIRSSCEQQKSNCHLYPFRMRKTLLWWRPSSTP